MYPSFWEKDIFIKNPQYLIIGAGLVGINAAISLKKQDPAADVLVIDARPMPGQASLRNAGFACFGSMTELLADKRQNGTTSMLSLVEKRWKGLEKMLDTLGKWRLDYQQKGGYELFMEEDQLVFERCMDHVEEINQALYSITGFRQCFSKIDAAPEKFGFGKSKHLLCNQAEGQLHAGKMMAGWHAHAVESGVRFLFGVKALSIKQTFIAQLQ